MPPVIRIAHDFVCPWCWVGLSQARRLKAQFGVTIEWIGYELFPETLEYPAPTLAAPNSHPDKPPVPTRMQLAYAAEEMDPPSPSIVRPKRMRIHNAHEAIEYAKTEGVGDELCSKLYEDFWLRGMHINDPEILRELAVGIVSDLDAMVSAIHARKFADKIVGFDDDAYASGVYNVPTFFIGEQLLAEQPYRVIESVMKAHIAQAT